MVTVVPSLQFDRIVVHLINTHPENFQAYEFHHARSAPSRRDTSYTAAALQERATSYQRASAAHATASASGIHVME